MNSIVGVGTGFAAVTTIVSSASPLPAELLAVISADHMPTTPSGAVSLPVSPVRVVISLRGFTTTIDALVAPAPAFQLKVTLVVLRIAELGLQIIVGTGT